jgi:hypothetical protein
MTSFPAPSDFKIPADAKEGEEFDSVATFKMSGGQLTLVAIAGSEIEDAEEMKAEPANAEAMEAEGSGDFMGNMKKRMSTP